MSSAPIRIIHPGPMTMVQDLGRTGWRHVGVALAGALDPDAAALANRLVGNAPHEAVLEYTLSGPTLQFDAPVRIALCGALVDAVHEDAHGRTTALGHGRPIELPPGRLRIGRLRLGIRGWLAVAGGIDVPVLMGSRSSDLRGGFGGLEGRLLRADDRLPLREAPPLDTAAVVQPGWWVEFDDPLPTEPRIRYVPGEQSASRALSGTRWQLDARSNRQGLRLRGENAIECPAGDAISGAVAPGTLQLPPDGQPIILMADAQTTGGYPRLGHVAAVDLPRLAQLAPGQSLQWEAIAPAESHRLWQARRAQWHRLMRLLDERLPRLPDPAGELN